MTDLLRLPDVPRSPRPPSPTASTSSSAVRARLPLVAVNLWYHVGSKNEERTQRGFAHLFEHLMFEGSEHYPGDFFKHLQPLGASINGSTSSDRTNYFVDLPTAHAELALAMESDRMAQPAAGPRRAEAADPEGRGQERIPPELREPPLRHGLAADRRGPLPARPSLQLADDRRDGGRRGRDRDDVSAFFRRYYVPSNASLAMVGDIDEDQAIALAERYFGPIPGDAGAPALDAGRAA